MYHLLWKKRNFVKRWVVVFYLLCAFFPSQAQFRELNLPDNDDKTWHLGIVVFGGGSRFQISQHPRFIQYDSILVSSPENGPAFGLGGMIAYKLSNRLLVRAILPQFMLANKKIRYNTSPAINGESTEVIRNVESILIGIPVHLKFQSDRIHNFRVYMFGGAKVEFDINSKAAARNAEDLVKLKSSDFGIEAGIGFNFYMPYFILSPEIKISNGLSNSHSRDPNLKFSNVIDKMNSRMIIFSLIFEG